MLSKDIVEATVAAANENGIAPAALLAVVEIESAGKPFEADGMTPRFLFERHKFYEELEDHAEGKLKLAIQQGLAHKAWKRSTQYADQGTSSGRLNLLSRASEIDKECAYLSCSWGLGQTMGNLHKRLGFPSAVAMVEAMVEGGIRAQIDLMVRFIRDKGLDKYLARRAWAAFARGYNGPRYEENKYDTKLAKAYARWLSVHPEVRDEDDDDLPEADIAEYGERGPLVEGYQKRLAELGYRPGTIDGIFGSHTRAAVLAFQAENGLSKDGRIGPLTRAALNRPTAKPMPVSPERANATVEDLAKSGSGTIIDAKAAETVSKVVVVTGVAKGVQDNFDVMGSLQSWVTDLSGIRAIVDPAIALVKWGLQFWWMGVIVAAIIILQKTDAIKKARVAAHRLGAHLGR
jgi:hypothetical protein